LEREDIKSNIAVIKSITKSLYFASEDLKSLLSQYFSDSASIFREFRKYL
jgi:hypothetical protein